MNYEKWATSLKLDKQTTPDRCFSPDCIGDISQVENT